MAAATPSRKSRTPKAHVPLSLGEYLQKILNARVYDVAIETALEPARNLSRRLGNQVLLKREDTQPVFSFKLRGAYNKMARLSKAQLARGVICASAGNHAQGVALAARRLGCKALIVMPQTTPQVKVDAVRSHGAEVVLSGESYSDAYLHAVELERQQGLTFVHPFDDPDVIAGQGTIAMEILRQHQAPIDAIFVGDRWRRTDLGHRRLHQVGAARDPRDRRADPGFGRHAALGQGRQTGAARRRRPLRRRHGRQAGRGRDLQAHPRAGRRLRRGRYRCGLRRDQGRLPGHPQHPRTFGGARRGGDQAVHRDPPLQGPDLRRDHLRREHELRPAALRRRARRGRRGARGSFRGDDPEERDSFRRFCELIGARAVTEFNYRISDAREAHVFVGLTTQRRAESGQLTRHFKRHGFEAIDLTDDELAKEHLRHLVGGRTGLAADERLYR